MSHYGYTVEKIGSIRKKLIDITKNWIEEAMSSIIAVAMENGIENIALHTAESISNRDPLVGEECEKIKIFYDNIAKMFGFSQQYIAEDDDDLYGLFWVKHLN
jgi:hypothetical protein